MKEGLEEFLKRIEAKPTNETLIDRFVTLVLEEDVLERILYLKKLVGLLLTPNPYAALKAAALELQEARKEKLTREYEVGALKDVESCFLKLEKMDNAQLVRDEINKLQSDAARERENTVTRGRTPPPQIPQPDRDDMDESPARQARVHYRLPSRPEPEDMDADEERTQQHRPQDVMENNIPPPSPPRSRTVPPTMPEPAPIPLAPSEADFNAEAFGYTPRRKEGTSSSFASQKEFYDKGLEETDDAPEEATQRSSLSKVSGLKVGPNILETPEDREPPRPRNVQSVFDVTDMFTPKEKPAEEKRPKADKAPKPSKDATKAKPRVFDANEYGDSNSLFQESQHVHFPENTANRSMTRQEARSIAAHLQHDMTGTSAVAAAPMENTEILPESKMLGAIPFDNEATRQLDPEELARSIVPPEPAFPPREFDVPPYDFAPTKAEAKAPKNKSKDPFAAVRDQPAIGNREVARDFGREGTAANPVGGREPGRDASGRDFGREGTAANAIGGRDFGREANVRDGQPVNAGREAMSRDFGRDANPVGGRDSPAPNAGREAMSRDFGRDANPVGGRDSPAPNAGREGNPINAAGNRDGNAVNAGREAMREFGREGNPVQAPANRDGNAFNANREGNAFNANRDNNPTNREGNAVNAGRESGRDNNPANAAREFGGPSSAAGPREFPADTDDGVFAPVRAVGRDPFAPAKDPFADANDPFAGMREPPPAKDPIPFPKEAIAKAAPAQAPVAQKNAPAPATEPRWSLLRDRLRLLTGLQISRSHASEFVLRLLGENASRDEQHEVLSILMRVLEGPRQAVAEQRFLAFLFEELQPKALHQLLGALKIGDQTVVFFVDYLNALMRERELRRTLNVIHAVIIPGLDLSWYQESYRFLMLIWPELGLKGWHWLEEEGPMVFCDRLALREDLLPATLLA